MLYWNACTKSLDRATNSQNWYGQFSHPNDVDVFLDNAALAICSTYHTVLIASAGVAIFG